jgi:hypothetical protein
MDDVVSAGFKEPKRCWKKKLQANDVAHVRRGYASNSAVLRRGEAKGG